MVAWLVLHYARYVSSSGISCHTRDYAEKVEGERGIRITGSVNTEIKWHLIEVFVPNVLLFSAFWWVSLDYFIEYELAFVANNGWDETLGNRRGTRSQDVIIGTSKSPQWADSHNLAGSMSYSLILFVAWISVSACYVSWLGISTFLSFQETKTTVQCVVFLKQRECMISWLAGHPVTWQSKIAYF